MAVKTLSSKLIFLGMLLLLALLDVVDGVSFFGDADDRMRDFQIRELLAGGQWYDLTFPFISMPEHYVSPWSRLVDFPYVAITFALSGMVGEERALFYAYQAWPLLMLMVFGLLIHSVIRRSLGGLPSFLELFATAIMLIYAVWQFVPGRIDHHNVQLLLMAAASYGLVRWDRVGAIILGMVCVASIHVGLETLPIIFAIFLGVIFTWVACRSEKDEVDGRFMATTSLSLIIGVLVFTSIQPGWGNAAAIACDTFSAPYIGGYLMVGALLFVAAILSKHVQKPMERLVLLSIFGLLIVGALIVLFPDCLDGPYQIIDPISRAFWLDTLPQEQGILSIIGEKQQLAFAPALMLIIIVPGFVLLALHKLRDGNSAWMVLCFAALAAIFLTLYQLRFFPFMVLLVPLCIPWCIRNLVVAKFRGDGSGAELPRMATFLSVAAVLLTLAGGVGWYLTLPNEQQASKGETDGLRYLHYDICEGDDGANLTYLKSVAPGRILAGFGASFAIAEAIVGNNLDHKIAALAFHRASPGIRQVAIAFTSVSKIERDEVLRKYDYVAVCGLPMEILETVDMTKVPLLGTLAAAKSSKGFELLSPPEGTRLRIYKISH
ncbi:MAG: hypothetical protein JKX91_10800 [Rhizobiaceae bacterium]|nr:hypothetical protein [Rhizobiaceae bacterium]